MDFRFNRTANLILTIIMAGKIKKKKNRKSDTDCNKKMIHNINPQESSENVQRSLQGKIRAHT